MPHCLFELRPLEAKETNRPDATGGSAMPMEPTQRRLLAILVADVVGYSRLIQVDEIGTLAAMQASMAGTVRTLR